MDFFLLYFEAFTVDINVTGNLKKKNYDNSGGYGLFSSLFVCMIPSLILKVKGSF